MILQLFLRNVSIKIVMWQIGSFIEEGNDEGENNS